MELKRAVLVLLHIHGYQHLSALSDAEQLHAEGHYHALLTALSEAPIAPLTVSKLDNAGLLLYALTGEAEAKVTHAVAIRLSGLFRVFEGKTQDLIAARTCRCAACLNLHLLRLTLVTHVGEVVFKQIRQFHELAGENMILVHRLLPIARSGDHALLATAQFCSLAGTWTPSTSESFLLEVDGLGQVAVRAYDVVD